MNIIKRKIPIIFLFLLSFNNLFSLEITNKEFETNLIIDYNKTFLFNGGLSFSSGLEFNNSFLFRTGISFGTMRETADIKFFMGAHINPFSFPLIFSLSYIYNWLPDYDVRTSTIMPVISYNAKWAGISIGYNFRFTTFFGADQLFETVLSASAYVNFANNEKLRIGLSIGNFSEFQAKNMVSYSAVLYSTIHINKNFSLINDIELIPSGLGGRTTVFYEIELHMGVKYSW
jgi:hypothetical protein